MVETGKETKPAGDGKTKVAAPATTKAIGADEAMKKAPGKKSIKYIGSDQSVSVTWLGLPFTFKKDEPKEVPVAMAASLLSQKDKFGEVS
jgi:hypothetical protein